jgi:hypothetical protein
MNGPLWAGGRRPRAGKADGIQIQTFALAARQDVLAQTLDDWLNDFLPPEVAIFRPLLPAVMCSLIYYREMGDAFSWQTGVSSQNEMYFAIPVARWQRTASGERLAEVGVVTPYIFVDNAESAAVGRSRFGFPKEVCEFHRQWGSGESARGFAPDEQWGMSVWDPSTTGRAKSTLLTAVATNRTRGIRTPRALPAISKLIGGDLGPAIDVARALDTIARAVVPTKAGMPVAAIIQAIRQGLSVSVFNFRQFGHPWWQGAASYQDLIRFRMRITDVRAFGIQPGGFQLRIARTMVRPIVDKLGLRVASRGLRGGAPCEQIDASAPVVTDVDLDLASVDRLCWRHGNATWHDDEYRALTPATNDLPAWNGALGPSQGGAFLEENGAERVLDSRILLIPIPKAAAAAIIARKVPPRFPGRVIPMTHGEEAALRVLFYRARRTDVREGEELVWLDGCYVSLMIPVRLERDGEPTLDVLLELGELTDNPFLIQAMHELALAEARLAAFDFGNGDWLTTTASFERLVRVSGLALDRERDTLRLADHAVIDVWRLPDGVVGRTPAPGWDEIWAFAGTLRAIMTCGTIDAPTMPPRPIVQRVAVSEVVGLEVCTPPREGGPDEHPAVVFHCSRSDETFDLLGLPVVPLEGAVGPLVRSTETGRMRIGHPVRSTAVAFRVRVAVPRLLWEDNVDAPAASRAGP